LPCQLLLVLATVDVVSVAEALLVAVALEVAATSAVALAQRRLSRVAEFDQRPLSGVRTLPVEVLTDQVPHLDSITVVIARLPCHRMDSLAQSPGLQTHMSAGPLRLRGKQTA